MIHKHIKSLPHHPKRVIIISLIIAVAVGAYGYVKINKKVNVPLVESNLNLNANENGIASRNLTLGFLSGGRIKSVSVKAGDKVLKGQVLATLDAENARGALSQAKAAYEMAEANYKKIINGATGTAIDVAKAAVNTAQVYLDGVTKQQDLFVANAHTNLLNSTLVANTESDNSLTPPSITGTYTEGTEGSITFDVNKSGSTGYITFSGIESGTATASTTSPQAIGSTGLYIEFSSVLPYVGTTWKIEIPNKSAPNYLSNYNAYQSALETRNQTIASAEAALDQANASLTALVTAARPEDVSVAEAQVHNAEGAVQIAEAALSNTIIVAPTDGKIVSVAITPGQIAVPSAPAIQFLGSD